MSASRWNYGSQYQLNRWLQERESALVSMLRERCETLDRWAQEVVWISPDLEDGGRESGDTAWHKVGLPQPSPREAQWWPTSGPRWDAVARVTGTGGQKGALFVEAKARRGEVCAGRMDQKTPRTVEQRRRALAQVRDALGVDSTADWTGPCYQVANRLAWLWFARRWKSPALPVWLASIYFCGERYPRRDRTAEVGPADELAWRPILKETRGRLGLAEEHALSPYIAKVFPRAMPSPPGPEGA